MTICKGYNEYICTNELEGKRKFCPSCAKVKKSIIDKAWLVNKKSKDSVEEIKEALPSQENDIVQEL